jgi:hypothetical protein
VYFIEYTGEMEEARARGELRTNSFVRLRRHLANEQARLEIEDLGSAESLLKNRRYFQNQARELLKRGILPAQDGWGGWLGQYQAALKQAATQLEYPAQARSHDRVRDRSRDR